MADDLPSRGGGLRSDHDRDPTSVADPDVLARAFARAERVTRSIAGGRTPTPALGASTITIAVSLPNGLAFTVTEPVTRPEPIAEP